MFPRFELFYFFHKAVTFALRVLCSPFDSYPAFRYRKARAKPVGVQRHFSSSSTSRKKKQEDNVVGFPTTKSSGILAGTTIFVLFLSRVMSNSSSSAFFFCFLRYITVRYGPGSDRNRARSLAYTLFKCRMYFLRRSQLQ